MESLLSLLPPLRKANDVQVGGGRYFDVQKKPMRTLKGAPQSISSGGGESPYFNKVPHMSSINNLKVPGL